MVKALKKNFKLFFCTCGKLTTDGDEDDIPYTIAENQNFNNSEPLQYLVEEVEDKDCEIEPDNPLEYFDDTINERKNKSLISLNNTRWCVLPHPEQEFYRKDLMRILNHLDNHSGKLDNIIQQLSKTEKNNKLQLEVLRFQKHLQKIKSLECSTQTATVSMTDNEDSLSFDSVAESESQGRVPEEHDEVFGSVSDSGHIAEIIRDQFNELRRCACEHSNNNTDSKISLVVSEMESEIDRLPINMPCRNRQAFQSPTFARAGYPSPRDRSRQIETIEMQDLSRKGFNGSLANGGNKFEVTAT